jgi:hypothetical protein
MVDNALARRTGVQLADRVIAQAQAAREAQRTTRAVSRASRRRSRAVTLPMVTLGRDLYVEPVQRMVDDPTPEANRDPGKPPLPVQATVNKRVDLLEIERGNNRINEGMFRNGRIIQALFERIEGGVGGCNWQGTDRIDAFTAHELQIINKQVTIESARKEIARVERAIGTTGTRFLRRMLTQGQTFEKEANDRGKGGDRGKAQIAAHFRLLLENITEAWEARGTAGQPIRGEAPDPTSTEETDVNGVIVRPGQGYRLAQDPARRWTPPERRTRLEGAAERRLRAGGRR